MSVHFTAKLIGARLWIGDAWKSGLKVLIVMILTLKVLVTGLCHVTKGLSSTLKLLFIKLIICMLSFCFGGNKIFWQNKAFWTDQMKYLMSFSAAKAAQEAQILRPFVRPFVRILSLWQLINRLIGVIHTSVRYR